MSAEKVAASGTLWLLRIVLGLPVLATPLLLFGGLFALLAHGITPLQQLHILAVIAYPIAYIVGYRRSSKHLRAGDVKAAERSMLKVLIYIVAVLALWPLIGFQ